MTTSAAEYRRREWAEEFDEALSQEELRSIDPAGIADQRGAGAAWRLARALGSCRLFDVALAERDGALPARVALAAGRLSIAFANQTRDRAQRLERVADEWTAPLEYEIECDGILEARMNLWAMEVALREADAAARRLGRPLAEALGEVRADLARVIAGLDDAMLANMVLLAAGIAVDPLATWRADLAASHRESLPWWLDGRLEDAGRRVLERAARSLPTSASWREVAAVANQRRLEQWLSEFPAPPTLALAADAAKSVVWDRLEWRADDGAGEAWLAFPEQPSDSLFLSVSGPNDDARSFAGRSVQIADLVATVSPEGWAEFPWRAIHERRCVLASLLVDGKAWAIVEPADRG